MKDTESDTLMPIIASRGHPDSVVYTDSVRADDQLDITDYHHNRIPRPHFHLFIKECERRFNYGSLGGLLQTLRSYLKHYSRS